MSSALNLARDLALIFLVWFRKYDTLKESRCWCKRRPYRKPLYGWKSVLKNSRSSRAPSWPGDAAGNCSPLSISCIVSRCHGCLPQSFPDYPPLCTIISDSGLPQSFPNPLPPSCGSGFPMHTRQSPRLTGDMRKLAIICCFSSLHTPETRQLPGNRNVFVRV